MFSFNHQNLFGHENKNREKWELLLYCTFLFGVPFFATQQLIVGTIVNALLIKASINHQAKKVIFLCALPSISVLLSGFIFGSLTPQVLWMLPFIWLGNFVIVLATRKLFVEKKRNFFASTLAGATAKTALLFTAAFALLQFSLVPAAFLLAFGIMQFITAESGAVIVWIHKGLKVKYAEERK